MTTAEDSHKHVGDKPGAWTRYRNSYEKLPPGVQLIGLQLWLPFFFVICFCFFYVLAFHDPTPRDLPVAFVGSSSSEVADAFAKQTVGEFDVTTVATLAEAREGVRSGELVAAFEPGTTTSTLVVASAAQYQIATLAKTAFTPVATQLGGTLAVDDLAPLPAGDSFGTVLFYVTLVFMIAGYMSAMFVGLMGGALRHRVRLAIIAGVAVVLPLIAVVITHSIIGAVSGNFFEIWGIGALTVFTVGLVTNGLAYFLGRFVAAGALLIFVFFTVPASGGAIPVQLVPEFFQHLHPFVAGTGTIELLRRAEYGVGPDVWSAFRIFAGYLVAGALLTIFGKKLFTRRMRTAAITGKRPSMLATAQGLAIAAGRKAAEEAANSAQGGGVGTAPSDGDARVDTSSVRVQAERDGQLHRDGRDHRDGGVGAPSGGPSASAVASASE